MQTHFDVVVLAGQDPDRPDPLALENGAPQKVFIEVGGQPMITHVVKALTDCPQIDHIVIIGMEPMAGLEAERYHFLPGQGSLLDNILGGFAWLANQGPADRFALLTTADLPLMTTAQVEWFLQACQPLNSDLYWGIVERRTMEARFPASRRSYLRVVEGQFCNGGLFLGKLEAALKQQALVRQLVSERKNIFRQLRLMGPGVVIKFLLRRLRLEDLLAVVLRLSGLRGSVVILPFAETGMDVDKPHHLEQVRAAFAQAKVAQSS